MAATREIRGLGHSLARLKEIDPKLEKQARKKMREIAKPIIQDAKQRIPDVPISGWVPRAGHTRDEKGQRTLRTSGGFPVFEAAKARSRIGLSIKNQRVKGFTGRVRLVAIAENDAAGQILDYAGRKNQANKFAGSLNRRNRKASRFMWPAAEGHVNDMKAAMHAAIREVEAEINRELRTGV